MISFGSNVWAATRPSFRSVLVSSMKPQINSMNVIGLVAIPGMLTGQVLGGSSPTHAARYQIMIMCLIMGAVFLSVSISVELIIWNAFDDKGALRDDWIVDNDSLRVSQLISSLWAISTLSRSSALQEVSTNEVKAKAIPELIAVELSVENQSLTSSSLMIMHHRRFRLISMALMQGGLVAWLRLFPSLMELLLSYGEKVVWERVPCSKLFQC